MSAKSACVSCNRNDPAPTQLLWDAWQRQGARGIPVGALVAFHRVGAVGAVGGVDAAAADGGVIYALGTSSTNIRERFVAAGYVYEPHRGDAVELSSLRGLQRFFAMHPLPTAPRSLAWIVHLVRMSFPGVPVDVDGGLTVEWEPLEETPPSSAASLLLGVPSPPAESRAHITLRAGDVVLDYAAGELSARSATGT